MWLTTTVDRYKIIVNDANTFHNSTHQLWWQKPTSPHVIVTILDHNSCCVTIIKPHTETISLTSKHNVNFNITHHYFVVSGSYIENAYEKIVYNVHDIFMRLLNNFLIFYDQYTLKALWNIVYFIIDKNILWNSILCVSIKIWPLAVLKL